MKKKGFTLIEILAVIVIIAVLAIITVPVVYKIIFRVQDNLSMENINGYIQAVETAVGKYGLELKDPEEVAGDYLITETGIRNIYTDVEIEVKIRGNRPKIGTLVIDKNAKVVELDIKVSDEKSIVMDENGKLIEVDLKNPYNPDTEPPQIEFTSDIVLTTSNPTFDPREGVLLTDNASDPEDITVEVVEEVSFEKMEEGTYTITYIVMDKAGNSVTVERTIEIVKADYVDASGANAPVLLANMIPIRYDGENWIYASLKEAWYNYDNKEWANAVVLNSGVTKEVGDPISEDVIALWYVWIPRYKYKLFNAQNGGVSPQVIEVAFEKGTARTGTVSCTIASNGTETCTNATNGNWYTHPAFTFGSTKLNGIWVGKFEVSTSNTTCSGSQIGSTAETTNCNKQLPVTIKPNVRSWRNAKVYYLYYSISSMANTYSITDGTTHMMKNIEWGAVAYLKQSKYGSEKTEVAVNTSVNFYTGGGVNNAYKTNVAQSTTGNITGIYDMSGGAVEYVMGNVVNKSGAFYPEDSGFGGAPGTMYYDIYAYDSSNTTHGRGHLGDATRETVRSFKSISGGWNSDRAQMPYSTTSWFTRGGSYGSGTSAGIFCFDGSFGKALSTESTRAVLVEK